MNELRINLDTIMNNYENVSVMQGYNYTLIANVTENFNKVDLTGCKVTVELNIANGKVIIQDKDITVTGNQVIVNLIDVFSLFSGKTNLNILIEKNDMIFGTWSLSVDVKDRSIYQSNDTQSKVDITETFLNTINEAIKVKKEIEDIIQSGAVASQSDLVPINKNIETINGNIKTINTSIDSLKSADTQINGKITDSSNRIQVLEDKSNTVALVKDQRTTNYEFDLNVSADFAFYNSSNYPTKGKVEGESIIIDTVVKRTTQSDKIELLNKLPFELQDGYFHQFPSLMCNSSDQGSSMLLMFQDDIIKVDWSFRNQNNFQTTEGCAFLPITLNTKLQKTHGLNPSNLRTTTKLAKETTGVSKVSIMTDCHYFKDANFAKKLRTFNDVVRSSNSLVGISLGDNVTEYKTNYDKAQFLDIIDTFRKSLLENMLIIGGNHDTNSNRDGVKQKAKQCMPNELYDAYMNGKSGINITKEGMRGFYYYYDDSANGVRYVMMNTNDTPYIEQDSLTWKYSSFATPCIREPQIKWLCDVALQTDLDIVIMSHIGFLNETEIEGYDTIPKNVDLVRKVLKGYKLKQKGNVSKVDGDFSVNADYDFTKRKGNIVASVFGHYHYQCKYQDSDGLWHIGIDDMQGDTTNYNLTKPYLKDFLPRDYTDEKSISAKIMMIDTIKKSCTLKTVGVGEDITFNY